MQLQIVSLLFVLVNTWPHFFCFFFFNDPPPTEIYPLPLHDALPIFDRGDRVALVGHTGAGKTTVTALLLRFYEPQRGEILINGVDIRRYTLASLRALFAIVQQDFFLRSEEHTSELQSQSNLVCRLLL